MTRRGFGAAGTAAIGVAIVLVYGRVTGFFFTDVDTLPLIATGRVASWSDFVDVMTSPLMGGQMPNALFYRPLASLSWGLDWALWGDVAAGYHVTDIALHGANALLLFGWLRSLGQDPSPGALSDSAVSRGDIEALLAALLFAVHPLTMETVPAIARRPDLLFCLFLLLTLRSLEAHRRDPGGRSLALAAVFATLGLASKDSAIAITGVAAVFVGLSVGPLPTGERVRAVVGRLLPMALAACAFVGLRGLVLGGIGGYAGANATYLDAAVHSAETLLCATWSPGNLDACRTASRLPMAAGTVAWLTAGLWLSTRSEARGDGSGVRFAGFVLSLGVFFAIYVATRTPAAPRTLYTATAFASAATAWSLVMGFGSAQRALRERTLVASTAAAVVVSICALIVSASIVRGVWTSRYVDEWRDAAEIRRRALSETTRAAASLPAGSTLYLVNYPYWVGDYRQFLRERPILLEHSVQGWVDLVLPDRNLDVVGLTYLVVSMQEPHELGSRVSFDPDGARLDIDLGRGAYATPSQWNNAYRPRRPEGEPTYYQKEGQTGLVVDLPPSVAAANSRAHFLVYTGDRVVARPPTPWLVSHAP